MRAFAITFKPAFIAAAAMALGHGLQDAQKTMGVIFLALLGGAAAKAGGASIVKGAWRVTFWGAVAMAVTALVGKLFGAVV